MAVKILALQERATANDATGNPLAGAKLYTYQTGTTTPLTTYTTSALNVANANPIVADAAGRFGPIYTNGAVAVKVVIETSAGATVDTLDPVAQTFDSQGSAAAVSYTPNATLTGDTVQEALDETADYIDDLRAITIAAGAGLTGGGNLTANRTLALTGRALALHNFTAGGIMVQTAAEVFASRSVAAGDGIGVTNGSGISGNPTVAVDSTVLRSTDTTVVRTTGDQTIAGGKTFSNTFTANNISVFNNIATFNASIIQGDADESVAGSRGIRAILGAYSTDFLVKATAAASDSADMIRVMKGVSTRFRVEADGDVTNTNNSYGAISDERLKKDIEASGPQLADLRQIEVVKYRLNDAPEDSPKHAGVIAQQLQTIKPGLVKEGEDGFLSVKYSVLAVLLLKAVQELADKVDALEAREGRS